MDVLRRTDLRNALEHELAFVTQRKSLTGPRRVQWLVEMLTEYVERWIGFCQPPAAGMHSMVEDSGFAMMEIGAGLLNRELRAADAPSAVISAWLGFISALSEMRDRADHRLIWDLEHGIGEVQSAMSAWKPPS